MGTLKIWEGLSASSQTRFASFITCSQSHVRRIRPERRVWSVASSHLSPETFSQMLTTCRRPIQGSCGEFSSHHLCREMMSPWVWSVQRDSRKMYQCARRAWWADATSLFHGSVSWFFLFVAFVIRLPPHLRVHLSTHFDLTWEAVTTCLISAEDVSVRNVSTEWGDFNEKFVHSGSQSRETNTLSLWFLAGWLLQEAPMKSTKSAYLSPRSVQSEVEFLRLYTRSHFELRLLCLKWKEAIKLLILLYYWLWPHRWCHFL